LENHRSAITDAFRAAYEALSLHIMPPVLDILIQRQDGRAIPEVGVTGRAYRSNLFALSCDPTNPHFRISLINGALIRAIVHEVHHCLRMSGPGYGRTLGEALVSEGLAGRFVGYILQSTPEPWEEAVDFTALKALDIKASTLSTRRYDHAEWFFGKGSFPRWLGYSLGYEIVGQWLATAKADKIEWTNVRAETPIAVAIERGLLKSG
jgi:hypothetical protein